MNPYQYFNFQRNVGTGLLNFNTKNEYQKIKFFGNLNNL